MAWYDHNYIPVAWLVSHYNPQDLDIFPTQSAFPTTGVNDGLKAYLALDQNTVNPDLGYYTWDTGTSTYIPLLKSNGQFYYRATHQHISLETSDTNDGALYTRLGIPYGYDVCPIYTANSNFWITDGVKNGKTFGFFILAKGKEYSRDSWKIYPNADVDPSTLYADSITDNTEVNNPNASVEFIGDASLTNGEHIIQRNQNSGGVLSTLINGYFVASGVITSWFLRATGSMSLRIGTTGNPNAINIDGTSGIVTITGMTSQLYKQLPNKVITNTIVETTAIDTSGSSGSVVLPANSINPNDRIKVEITGRYTTTAVANAVTLRLKLGAVVMMQPDPVSFTLPLSQTNASFKLVYILKVNSNGVSGTISTDCELQYDNGTVSDIIQRWQNVGSDVVNTTTTQTMDMTAQFTTATADSIEFRDIVITKY
jgi:hypothetical protein